MLDEKLKSESYYLDKLSMFMRNSPGVAEHFSMMVSILNVVDDALDDVTHFFNITDDNVFLELEKRGDSSDILDKIAHIYGLRRSFTLKYVEQGTEYTRSVTLNDFELWMLIKAQLLQSCFDGSFGQMREFYDKMHIPVFIFSDASPGSAMLILNKTYGIQVGNVTFSYADNPNIEYLFKANMLTIKSMGITYLTSTIDISTLGVWDSQEASRSWDNAKWGL